MNINLDAYIENDVVEGLMQFYGEGNLKVTSELAREYPTLTFAVGYHVRLSYDSYDVIHITRIK